MGPIPVGPISQILLSRLCDASAILNFVLQITVLRFLGSWNEASVAMRWCEYTLELSVRMPSFLRSSGVACAIALQADSAAPFQLSTPRSISFLASGDEQPAVRVLWSSRSTQLHPIHLKGHWQSWGVRSDLLPYAWLTAIAAWTKHLNFQILSSSPLVSGRIVFHYLATMI